MLNQLQSIAKSHRESETTLKKLDTTDKEDQPRVYHKVMFLIEEAELEETIDPESKVEEEETSVTLRTNLTEINIKNQHNKSLLLLHRFQSNKLNQKNPKN